MTFERGASEEQAQLLAKQDSSESPSIRHSHESSSSISTTSLILEGINRLNDRGQAEISRGKPHHELEYRDDGDLEAPSYNHPGGRPPTKGAKRLFWIVSVLAVVGWLLAGVSFWLKGSYKRPYVPYNPEEPPEGSGRKVTLEQVLHGEWYAHYQEISWIAGADGEDGLLLEENQVGKDYLVVEDVRDRQAGSTGQKHSSKTLMKKGYFEANGKKIFPQKVWPSPDLKWVLVVSEVEKNWRHSFTGVYWIIDVQKQEGQPLDSLNPDSRVQLASWSPTSNAVAFTRDNNMFIRDLKSGSVKPITKDGGPQHFCGVPDWVYEEEIYQTNSVTWWANDGKYIAYLKTDEAAVPEFPVQYFLSRPSGKAPTAGLENYPEVRQIKYPKAGAPNPTVVLEFYDVDHSESFSVPIEGQFADDNRLIIEVLWAAKNQVLIRQTNRESDSVRIILIDVKKRTGKIVRTDDIAAIDGGWVEPTQTTAFIPADPDNGRPHDGYVDTVIHDNNDHLAYFSPLDANKPVFLTGGDWEVVKAPSAVDLKNNLVYFTATKEAPTQRHVYSVFLNGTNLEPICPTDKPAYYSASFSKGAGYALLSNKGPDIPSQKITNTPSNAQIYEETVETNPHLAGLAAGHDLPRNIYSTVTIDGFTLQVVERRPPHFDESKKYPTLFYLYGGPGSQQVDRQFKVDFQAYIASNLGYLVVTVDGRGTGFIGRKARCSIRDDIGKLEARDQIETAKIWAAKSYVDEDRLAIWGWSYGGFMTLKTLETDAGQTFQYGMAVAPVTDWRFYDSVYTERYMHTPQHNQAGYDSSAITNTSALNGTVRFLVMHGTADDNVHTQNTLVLLDKLDLGRVENYDVHVFPDSDHSIFFHNANEMVYRRLSNWLVNAFNGEWYRTSRPRPKRPSEWSRHRRRSTLDTPIL